MSQPDLEPQLAPWEPPAATGRALGNRSRLRAVRDEVGRPTRLVLVGAAVAAATVVTGAVLRFLTTSALWLDEAQSVVIARQPLSHLPTALRQDGAPPLYYVLLHGWVRLFGDGDVAVRALSGLCSVAAIATTAYVVRLLAGRRAGAIAAIVLATNPLAIRYATEARMYGLLTLEVSLALLALVWMARRPSDRWAMAALAVATAAVLYTHYWGLYLTIAAVAVLAAWYVVASGPQRRIVVRALLAIAGGTILWLPWVPSFLEQLRHTGTPWARPAPPAIIVSALFDLNGGSVGAALTLTLLTVGAAALALTARRNRAGRLELRRPEPGAPLGLALLVVATLAIGAALGLLFGVAFASRYASAVLVPFVVIVALGIGRLSGAVRYGTTAVVAILGLVVAFSLVGAQRTQAVRFAAALRQASPGDVVVYCPDQLGPATARLLNDRLTQLGYPRGDTPAMVDWVDYGDAWRTAWPAQFAAQADALAGAHTVWLVVSTSYLGTEQACGDLLDDLQGRRPYGRVAVRADGRYFENAFVWELPPP